MKFLISMGLLLGCSVVLATNSTDDQRERAHRFFKMRRALHEGADMVLNHGFKRSELGQKVGAILAPCKFSRDHDEKGRSRLSFHGADCQVNYVLVTKMFWSDSEHLHVEQHLDIKVLGADVQKLVDIQEIHQKREHNLTFDKTASGDLMLLSSYDHFYDQVRVQSGLIHNVDENFDLEVMLNESRTSFSIELGKKLVSGVFLEKADKKFCSLDKVDQPCEEFAYVYGYGD